MHSGKDNNKNNTICVASLQKDPDVTKNIEIFVDLNRAGHDKSVKKN